MVNKTSLLVILGLAAAACAHMASSTNEAPAKAEVGPAANTNLPEGTPIWKQGMQNLAEKSALAPHPPKLVSTAEAEIDVAKIKAPPGFKVELCASGMPGARMMARSPGGTVYVGTRASGRVQE